MNAQIESWYEAIGRRRSRRTFLKTEIESQKLDGLRGLMAELNKTVVSCRIELVASHGGTIFSGIRGGYGVIKGAPSYLAFIVSPQSAGAYEHIGYIGQAAVLEATRLQLGTCWVSGTFDSSAAGNDLSLAAGEQVAAVSPLGYPKDGHSFAEKIVSGLAGSRNRKALEEISAGEPLDRWPEWARTAAEAGRLAPSAMNRQPWIFRFESDRLFVETDGGGGAGGRYSKRLDCGIALRHVAVAAQHSLHTPVSVEFLEAPQVASVGAEKS